MSKNYVTTSERHAMILNELNLHDKVHISTLVEKTGSGLRNIQMDLNERLKYPFGIETDGHGYYWIDKRYQGLFTTHDIREFSRIVGILEIFPDFDTHIIKDIIDGRLNNSILIKPIYKDHIHNDENFKLLVKAINDRRNIFFRYNDKTSDISPYKLLNMYGSWYLCGTHNGVLKTYKYSKVSNVRTNNNNFIFDESILREIEETDTIWMSNRDDRQNKTVKLKTTPDFTQYFKDNITIPGEFQREEQDDGSIVISVEVNIGYEILSIVKYWIPRLEILEPAELREELSNQLKEYMKNN